MVEIVKFKVKALKNWLFCHSRESGSPEIPWKYWIPAFTGM